LDGANTLSPPQVGQVTRLVAGEDGVPVGFMRIKPVQK
jgi:hypothetical protein